MPRSKPPVTVEHITNSLAQIENWIKAIRGALAGMEPETKLEMPKKTRRSWAKGSGGPILIAKNCPPPD
jgi:hypothetical protein